MNNQLYTKLNKNFIKHNKILFKVIKTKKIIIKNFLMLIKLLFFIDQVGGLGDLIENPLMTFTKKFLRKTSKNSN